MLAEFHYLKHPYTLLGNKKSRFLPSQFVFIFIFSMAQYDENFEAPLPDAHPGDRMQFLEHQLQYLFSEVTQLRGVQNQPPPPFPVLT